MSDLLDEPADATPLEPDEREGLLQTWITYRRDLNEAEQTNVAKGTVWARRIRRRDLLTQTFLQQLHKRLFGDVWASAGSFRRTERNIGVEPMRVPVELRTAFDDASYWIDHRTFPRFTPHLGQPRLKEHRAAVTALTRAAANWDQFRRSLKRSSPVLNDQYEMNLGDD